MLSVSMPAARFVADTIGDGASGGVIAKSKSSDMTASDFNSFAPPTAVSRTI